MQIYNFAHNKWNPLNWLRNAATVIGGAVAGKGMPYSINLFGSKWISPVPSVIK
jgi:hypothetical protein